MEDVLKIHRGLCHEHEPHAPIIQLSLDGVMESRSSMNSLDVFSIKFNHCRNIYPIRLIKPCQRFRYDEQEILENVLEDINNNNVVIDCVVLDNPKRSNMRCAKTACAKFGCEYCVNCAVSYVDLNKKSLDRIRKKYKIKEKQLNEEIEEQLQTQDDEVENEYLTHLEEMLAMVIEEKEAELKRKGRKQLTWPASTMEGNLRTLEAIREISDAIENNPDIVKTDPDFCKGIKGKSLLLNQPFFHLIKDMPCEYMHLVCLGVVKRMVELNFKVGPLRETKTKRKLSSPSLFNDLIRLVQLPRECSRRCRNLDIGVMKASEYRNILILFFPIVLECIEDEFRNDKAVWLHLAYMVRACLLPNNEFRKIDDCKVISACKKFYHLYEKLFGQVNCTYSIHVISHLLLVRGSRPLTYKSAFKFESFFSEMRNLFQPGTTSTLKQILQNCYIKRMLEYHTCEKKIVYGPPKNTTIKENNSLIYTYNEDDELCIYSIIEILDHNSYNCNMQGKFPAKFAQTPEYDWSDVGVFKIGPVSEETYVVQENMICGKVVKVNGFLITFPNNVLMDQ